MTCGHLLQRIHDTAGHNAKIPAVQRYIDHSQALEQTIVEIVGETLQRAFLAPGADGVDHVVAVMTFAYETEQFFGRVLQIRVDDGDDVPRGVENAGCDGSLMAASPAACSMPAVSAA